MEAQGGELADMSGLSVTKDPKIAQGFADGRAMERGGKPTVIKTTREKLEAQGVKPKTGIGLTEAGEEKILKKDFPKVGPGVFERVDN